MLQCIVGMVEKTKRALAVLHQRSIQDREELALWARRHSQSVDRNFNKRPPSGETAISPVEDRVTEVKRRAGTSQAGISNKIGEFDINHSAPSI